MNPITSKNISDLKKHLHPDDLFTFIEVRAAMHRVATFYGLCKFDVHPNPTPTYEQAANSDTAGQTGVCYRSGKGEHMQGTIYLTLRAKVKGKRELVGRSADEVWRTAAHELAHLRHMDHGEAFNLFEFELLEAMRNERKSEKDKVIDKIIKMQAVRDGEAKLGNTAAAEAFAGAINRMLIENELSATDLDYARASDDDPVIELGVDRSRYLIDNVRNRVAWQESLARIVARNNMCTFLLRPGSNWIAFVGTRSHASVAEYTYGVLASAAHSLSVQARYEYGRERAREGGKASEANGFRAAWIDAFVTRIDERLAEARADVVKVDAERRAARGEANPTTTAMIRLNGAMAKVNAYINDKYHRRGANALAGTAGNHAEGRARGKAAADSMPIGRKGIAGGVRGLLK